jgi:hypothetical protein
MKKSEAKLSHEEGKLELLGILIEDYDDRRHPLVLLCHKELPGNEITG